MNSPLYNEDRQRADALRAEFHGAAWPGHRRARRGWLAIVAAAIVITAAGLMLSSCRCKPSTQDDKALVLSICRELHRELAVCGDPGHEAADMKCMPAGHPWHCEDRGYGPEVYEDYPR